MADETRVRTEKTGRIGHEAVTEATYVFDRSRAQSPTDTAFSFRQAFSFGPRGGAPEISLRSKDVLGIPVLPQKKRRINKD